MDTHSDSKTWTYDDLIALPRGEIAQRYEILDGELVVSPGPAFLHQDVLKRLLIALHEPIEKRGSVRDRR